MAPKSHEQLKHTAKDMNPKIRDQIAIAVGVALVYLALNKKSNAKVAILTAVGAATALWVVHQWDNAEDQ